MGLGDDRQLPDHVGHMGLRGHLAEEVGICPKKDDVAMLAVISLGYDSP